MQEVVHIERYLDVREHSLDKGCNVTTIVDHCFFRKGNAENFTPVLVPIQNLCELSTCLALAESLCIVLSIWDK